jgi:hypothetical protein
MRGGVVVGNGRGGETFTYLWYKTDINGIRKNMAILQISNEVINYLISTYGGNSPVVWLIIAVELHKKYRAIFPPIWDTEGNLNALWGSSILEKLDDREPIDVILPVFKI